MRGRRRRTNSAAGLNENYGRELMELHTLGVDGGYTQKDVTKWRARSRAGRSTRRSRAASSCFEPRMHDTGEKTCSATTSAPAAAIDDGEEVLDILAKHPSTAHLIAFELAQRFVSDEPPAALVDRAADAFLETDGDLREVMRTILTSPEFLVADAYRAKVKTPFEFVVCAVRATGARRVTTRMPLVRRMQQLGMPLYRCQPPTGYRERPTRGSTPARSSTA